MKRRNILVSVFLAVMLGSVVVSPAQAAVDQRPASSTYHDAAFSFTYPTDWSSMSPALGQQLKSLFAGFKQQMRVTDVGGVQNGVGPSFGAAIVVMRLRLSRTVRLEVQKDQPAFVRAILNGITLSAHKVLGRSSTTISSRPATAIDFIQGAGSVKLHQRISLVLAANDTRLYLVYFIARKSTWNRFLSAFNVAAGSMSLKGAA